MNNKERRVLVGLLNDLAEEAMGYMMPSPEYEPPEPGRMAEIASEMERLAAKLGRPSGTYQLTPVSYGSTEEE